MTVETNGIGFADAFCNFLVSVIPGLVKGTNLFVNDIMETDLVEEDAFSVFEVSISGVVGSPIPHYNWEVRIVTSRPTQRAARDAVFGIVDKILGKRPKIISDSGDKFFVKNIVTSEPGVVVSDVLNNGRFLGEASITVNAIPN